MPNFYVMTAPCPGDTNMYNPEIHHRRSIRLRDFDYSTNGAYFVTICTQGRECLFGGICDGEMISNEAGRIITQIWTALAAKFPEIVLGEFVIMPNHFHGIICIVGADPCVCPPLVQSDPCVCPPLTVGANKAGAHTGAPLHTMIQWFKTMTTNAYIHGVKDQDWSPFPGRLWQRNYYERIIRDENELTSISEYIALNPMRWAEDKENPDLPACK
jgi:putative transposase